MLKGWGADASRCRERHITKFSKTRPFQVFGKHLRVWGVQDRKSAKESETKKGNTQIHKYTCLLPTYIWCTDYTAVLLQPHVMGTVWKAGSELIKNKIMLKVLVEKAQLAQ